MESQAPQISEQGQGGQGQGLAQGKEAVQRSFQALKKSFEPIQGFGEALALTWAWFKSWFAIASNGYKIYQMWPTPDVSHLAPQVVLVVGLVVTNVLGFLNFWHQGLHREAVLAAVDLDSPFFAYGHMINALRGETNPEFQKVCLRNSIWRSLPLAMLTCALTSRLLIEVPLCQVFASGSAIAVGFWPEDRNQSMWVSSLPRDHAQPFAAEWAEYYEKFADHVKKKDLESRDSKKLEERMLAVEKKLWTAAHCNASTWTLTKRPLKQERMEDQVGAAGDETDEEQAGNGLNNLVPLNMVLFEEAKQEAVKREETLKPAVITLINKLASGTKAESVGFYGTLALEASDWNWVLDQAIGFLKKSLRTDHVETFESSRPWTLELGSFFSPLSLGEWEMPLGQAFGLLLVAVLPVRKKILSSFGSEVSSMSKVLVTLYTSLDMCALVMTWLLCAVAPLAKRFGAGISEFITKIWPLLERLLVGFELHQAPNVMFGIMKETSTKLLDMLEDVEPALAWDSKFFLQLTLGSLGFILTSAGLAYWVSPGLPVSTCASIGVCGPLWIFTEETVPNRGRRAFTLVLFRCLLLMALVTFSWAPASDFSVKLFSALTVKKIIDKESFMYYWLPFLFVTLLLGLAGASSLSGEESSDSSDGESEDPKDVKSSASSDYGTFNSSESIPQQSIERPAVASAAGNDFSLQRNGWSRSIHRRPSGYKDPRHKPETAIALSDDLQV
eukprot:symbB.v1.2.019183.t2/scaffold1558.1/size111825/6